MDGPFKMVIQPNVLYGSLGKSVMSTPFRLGDAWLNEYFPNKKLVKVFIQPNVSYGSLGKSVMPTTFRLGDTWLHENQLKSIIIKERFLV